MSVIENYKLIKDLGSGHYSKVKLAVNLESGNECALKLMPRSEKHTDVKEIMNNEVNLLKSCDHPNIVKLIGYNDHATITDTNQNLVPVYSLELEYANHGELFDFIHEAGRFSEKEARFYFKQLIDSLEYLHKKGYCHRDIKPENLLLDSEFNLKLADFGLSTNSGTCNSKTGTLGFMSPEILKRKKYDGKNSDLFAAAVNLFVMVYQHAPFKKASPHDRYYKKVVSGDTDDFWRCHEKKNKSERMKSSSSFKDLFIKMISLDPKSRLTIDEIKQHEWYLEHTPALAEIKADMKLRHRVFSGRECPSEAINSSESLLHGFDIPNDDDVKPKKKMLGRKGLKVKKYSEYFRYQTTHNLLSVITEFAESNDMVYSLDPDSPSIHLGSKGDDVMFSSKVTIMKNPSEELRCLELEKLEGEKSTFIQVFNKLCEHCVEQETTFEE